MKTIVTKIGIKKITEATIEKPLKITKFGVGDGGGKSIEPNEEMKSLVNEIYRDYINDIYTNANSLTIECVLKAKAEIKEGFTIREIGIYDEEGDLIAISQTPEQYRPGFKETVATEWTASVVLNISNTKNITINIPQAVYATVDAFQRLLNRVSVLENTNIALIKSRVGIDRWFNTNNLHKGKKILTIGLQTWGLMEEGNILKISEYPDAYKNSGAIDRGDGTFQIPVIYPDTTIKHIKSDNARELGTYEADDIKAHSHIVSEHYHDIPDIKGQFWGNNECVMWTNGAFASINSDKQGTNCNKDFDNAIIDFSSHRAGVTKTHNSSKMNTSETGGKETRMKNIAGQWYLLLKVYQQK